MGYSNILFGLMMLETFIDTTVDHPYQTVFGLFKIKKVFVPWVMMFVIQFAMPEASLIGHLSGIIAALLIKLCLKYVLIPKRAWIEAFEERYHSCITSIGGKVTYYRANENV